jgi:uncharacterized protein
MNQTTAIQRKTAQLPAAEFKGITEQQYEDLLWMMVEEALSCSAHDIDHVRRVYKLALQIAGNYPEVNYEVLIPAVLLHDIGRREEDLDLTGRTDHAVVGAVKAREILEHMGIREEVICEIQKAIVTHRYRSGRSPASLEAAILYDADKLDAIGAVGIARTFMMAGQEGARLYRKVDLETYTAENLTENGRIQNQEDHAPNVEYMVKLKHIPDRLITEAGRALAHERANLMKDFFDALDREMGE